MNNKLILLIVLSLLLFSNVFAECPPDCGGDLIDETIVNEPIVNNYDFSNQQDEYDYYNDYNNWEDEGFQDWAERNNYYDDPDFVDNAYNYLSIQSSFSEKDYLIATKYFEKNQDIDFNNPKNLVIGDNYFLSSDKGSNLINFQDKSEIGEEYLTAKYGVVYSLTAIGDDFFIDTETGKLTNNGKIIPLYKDDLNLEIETVFNGIIVRDKNTGKEIRINGAGSLELEDYSFVEGDNFANFKQDKNFYTLENIVQGGLEIKTNEQGELIFPDGAKGQALINGESIRFNAHGLIIFNSDGSWKADDAEIHTDTAYVNGRSVRKVVKVNGETKFDYGLQDFNGQRTTFVDLSSGVGVVSQGQSRFTGEMVVVHQDAYSSNSKYVPLKLKNIAEAREVATKLKSTPTDEGYQAEVWIKNNGATTSVYAQGKVLVQNYYIDNVGNVLGLDKNKLKFVGKDNNAKFDYILNGERENFELKGLAEYEDSQFFLETEQQGTTILKQAPINSNLLDVLEVSCLDCSSGNVLNLKKKMVVVNNLVNENGVVYSEDFTEHDFNIVVTSENGNLNFNSNVNDLKNLALKFNNEDSNLIFDKEIFIKINGEENYFGLSNAGIGRYEKTEDGVIKGVGLIFDSKSLLGNTVVVTSFEQKEKTDQLFDILQNKNYVKLNDLSFSDFNNPQLEKLLLRETGIKISLLDNIEYRENLINSLNLQNELDLINEQLADQWGVEIDSRSGACLGTINKCKIFESRKNNALAQRLKLQKKLLQSENYRLLAEKIVNSKSGKNNEFINKQISLNKKSIHKINNVQNQYYEIWEKQQTTKKQKEIVLGFFSKEQKIDLTKARDIGKKIKLSKNEINKVNAQIVAIDRDLKKKFSKNTAFHLNEINKLNLQRKRLEQDLLTLEQKHSSLISNLNIISSKYEDPVIKSKLFINGRDFDQAIMVASEVNDADISRLLIVEACARENNAVCVGNVVNDINDKELQQLAGKVKEKLEKKIISDKFTEQQFAYTDLLEKNAGYEEDRDRLILSLLDTPFADWDPIDIELENTAEKSARGMRDASLIANILITEKGYSVDEINSLSENEVKAILGKNDIGNWNGYKVYHLNYIVQELSGETLTPQQQVAILSEQADNVVAQNHFDVTLAEPYYERILEICQRTGVGCSVGEEGLALVEAEKITIPGYDLGSKDSIGRLAAESVDVLAIADIGAGVTRIGLKGLSLTGELVRSRKLIKVATRMDDILNKERYLGLTSKGKIERELSREMLKSSVKTTSVSDNVIEEIIDSTDDIPDSVFIKTTDCEVTCKLTADYTQVPLEQTVVARQKVTNLQRQLDSLSPTDKSKVLDSLETLVDDFDNFDNFPKLDNPIVLGTEDIVVDETTKSLVLKNAENNLVMLNDGTGIAKNSEQPLEILAERGNLKKVVGIDTSTSNSVPKIVKQRKIKPKLVKSERTKLEGSLDDLLDSASVNDVKALREAGVEGKVVLTGIQSKDLLREVERLPKNNPLYLLELSTTKKIVRDDGKILYAKMVIDDKFKELSKADFVGILDTGRRQLAFQEIAKEFDLVNVPKIKSVSFGDGTSMLVSEGLEGEVFSLGKINYYNGLDDYRLKLALDSDFSAKEVKEITHSLEEQIDFNNALDVMFRNTDAEYVIVGNQIQRIDDEFFAAGFNLGGTSNYAGDRIYKYGLMKYNTKKEALREIKRLQIGSNDVVSGGIKKADFFDEKGVFKEDVFEQRFGKHITQIEEFTQSPAGRAKLRSSLASAGYDDHEILRFMTQINQIDLKKDMIKWVKSDGNLLVAPNGKLLTRNELINKIILPDILKKPNSLGDKYSDELLKKRIAVN